jgi:hypothetical protein
MTGTPAGGTFSGAGVSGSIFTPSSAGIGTHTITYTVTSGGCTATATQVFTVNPAPTVTFGAMPALCVNAPTYPLTTGSPAGGTYSGPGVTGGAFYAATAGVGTHTLTYTYTTGGCTGTATQTITVNPLPSVTHTPVAPVCRNGGTMVITGGSPAGGTYSGPGVTSAGVFNPTAVSAGATTLLYSYTNADGCTSSVPVVIMVQNPPVANISTIPTLCSDGGTFTLFATPTGGTFSGTGVSGNTFDPMAAGIGSHAVTYTYSDGVCTVSMSRNVIVTDCSVVPGSTPSAPNYLIVEGIDTRTLRLRFPDTNSDEDGYEIYRSIDGSTWTLHVTTAPYNGTAEAVYFDSENTVPDEIYYYIVRAKRGAKRSPFTNSAHDYTYPEVPMVSVLQAACTGGTGKFKATGTHASNRFRWYGRETGGEPFMGSDGNIFEGNIFTTPNISTTTVFFVTSKGKKYESKPRTAVTMPTVARPVVAVIGDLDKKSCGNALSIAIEAVSGVSYEWRFNGNLIAGANENTLTATQSGIYQAFVNNGSCVSASAPIQVTLNYKPKAEILQGNATTLCENGVISAKTISGVTYEWYKDGDLIALGANLTVSASGIYVLKATEYGCENTAEINVSVLKFPSVIALTADNETLCEGSTVVLTTSSVAGATYRWYRDGRTFANTAAPSISVRRGGTYTAEIVLSETCSKQSAEIFINEVKSVRLSKTFDGINLVVIIPDGVTVSSATWTIDGEPAPSITGQLNFKPTKNGFYELTVLWSNGCESKMRTNIILGALGTDDADEHDHFEISLAPNPTSETVFVSFGKVPNVQISYTITDNLGRVMTQNSVQISDSRLSISVSGLPAGLYTLSIRAGNLDKTFKFVKE